MKPNSTSPIELITFGPNAFIPLESTESRIEAEAPLITCIELETLRETEARPIEIAYAGKAKPRSAVGTSAATPAGLHRQRAATLRAIGSARTLELAVHHERSADALDKQLAKHQIVETIMPGETSCGDLSGAYLNLPFAANSSAMTTTEYATKRPDRRLILLYLAFGLGPFAAFLKGSEILLGLSLIVRLATLLALYLLGSLGSIPISVVAFFGTWYGWHWPVWEAALFAFAFVILTFEILGTGGIHVALRKAFARIDGGYGLPPVG
jgi:hypothetical protein